MLGLLSPEKREWLNIAASWASAVATFAAVIVALWLARRDRQPRLLVRPSIVRLLRGGQRYAEGLPLYSLMATNIGSPPVMVTAPCWRVGLFRRKVLYQIPPDLPSSTPLPKELAHGQQLMLRGGVDQFADGLFHLFEEVGKHPFPALALRTLRAGFDTSIEKKFFGRPNWELQRWLKEQFAAHKSSTVSRELRTDSDEPGPSR
jgi:hypothetical protein